MQGLLSSQLTVAPGWQDPEEQISPIVQALLSLQEAVLLVCVHDPAEQTSSVQGLLSLQALLLAQGEGDGFGLGRGDGFGLGKGDGFGLGKGDGFGLGEGDGVLASARALNPTLILLPIGMLNRPSRKKRNKKLMIVKEFLFIINYCSHHSVH